MSELVLVILLVIGALCPLVHCRTYYADDCPTRVLTVYEFASTTIEAWRSSGDTIFRSPSMCTINFEAGVGSRVEVNFRELNIPCGGGTNIVFYDGSDTSAIKITTIECSSPLPDQFLSSGPYLTAEIFPGISTSYDFRFSVYERPPGVCDDGSCTGDGKLEVTTILKIVGAAVGVLVLIGIIIWFIIRYRKQARERRNNMASRQQREQEFLATYQAEHPEAQGTGAPDTKVNNLPPTYATATDPNYGYPKQA
ncbi:uncharacterized protein LOC106155177 [Lingula anatina]|uniref:Uncharacterized protein LOC106155177 n=1 Tax=Lingula anatina TaxID=7574 RepID=A0A1S3HGX9_LINAN|nr:uncharacterized protein LOC106155177 [Lingula anatina]|eukprot:XP_013385330.1 uncharacterized protein LOC106155177 [Lingula anatina]